MPFDHLHHSIQQAAARVVGTMAQPRFGTVASVDPSTHAVRVLIQPEGVLSPWLPTVSQNVGAGWGVTMPHSPGDQVVIMPTENSLENAVVLGGIFSDSQQPPQTPAVPDAQPTHGQAGEFTMRHRSGSYLRFCADGSIISTGTVWNHTGLVKLKGDLLVDGNITSTMDITDAHGSIDRLRRFVDSHQHRGVVAGGGTSGAPTTQDPE